MADEINNIPYSGAELIKFIDSLLVSSPNTSSISNTAISPNNLPSLPGNGPAIIGSSISNTAISPNNLPSLPGNVTTLPGSNTAIIGGNNFSSNEISSIYNNKLDNLYDNKPQIKEVETPKQVNEKTKKLIAEKVNVKDQSDIIKLIFKK